MEFFGKVEFRRHGGASASWVGRWAVLGGRVDMWVGGWAGRRVGGWVVGAAAAGECETRTYGHHTGRAGSSESARALLVGSFQSAIRVRRSESARPSLACAEPVSCLPSRAAARPRRARGRAAGAWLRPAHPGRVGRTARISRKFRIAARVYGESELASGRGMVSRSTRRAVWPNR